MKGLHFFYAFIILAIAFTFGCSSYKGDSTGVIPPQEPERLCSPNDDGHALMGLYTIRIDAENLTVEAIRNREAEAHFNVTPYLLPPNCYDCFFVKILNVDPIAKNVNIRVTLKNPTNLSGYDVRGIILNFGGMTLLNPDSYTKLFGPGAINPFVAWIPNQDRIFYPMQVNYEDISIHNPIYPSFPAFEYLVEASWPGHCREPYEVHPFNVSGDLNSDGTNSVLVNCMVYDWQNNIASVTIDLTPIGGAFDVPMNDLGGSMWQKQITYISGPGEGYYSLLITATTSDAVVYNQTYHYAVVHVIGAGTEFPVEFGDEERVSFTSGASFMWPKHALAVDSSGLPHIVWSDNDPDPYSNIFKLYYSYRNASGLWQTPILVGSADVDAVYATMCIDEGNVVHIVWEDQRPGQLASDIYYTNSNSNFTNEVKLTTATPQVRRAFPRCAFGNGKVHIVWHDNRTNPGGDDYDVYYIPYDPNSGPGTELAVEAQAGIYEGYPSIDLDSNGDIHVAYQEFNSVMQIFHREKSGSSFGTRHLVADNKAYQPAIRCGNNPNDVFVAFYDYSGGTFCSVYLSASNNGGTSFNKTKVSTVADEYQVHPDVLQAQTGDIYMVWAEEGYVDIDGIAGPDDLNKDGKIDQNDAVPHRVYFRQSMGLGLQPPIILTGNDEAAAFPQIDVGVDKFVHVGYMKWTLDTPYNNYEIYYRRSLPW